MTMIYPGMAHLWVTRVMEHAFLFEPVNNGFECTFVIKLVEAVVGRDEGVRLRLNSPAHIADTLRGLVEAFGTDEDSQWCLSQA